MMEIISSPPAEVTPQAFNSVPLRFKMLNDTVSDDTHSPSPSPPGLESAHTGCEGPSSTAGSPSYPKASSASTLPYPSPPVLPPLDLSSVPTSPVKDHTQTDPVGLTRPASVGITTNRSPTNTGTRSQRKTSSESLSSTNPMKYHSENVASDDQGDSIVGQEESLPMTKSSPISASRTPPCAESDQPQTADWTQILQNFTAFCQGKVNPTGQKDQDTNSTPTGKKARPETEDPESGSKQTPNPDALSQFQAMLLSMGQMLFNSQSNVGLSGPPTTASPPSGTSPVKTDDDSGERKGKQLSNSPIPVTQADQPSTHLPVVSNDPNVSQTGSNRNPLSSPATLPGMPMFNPTAAILPPGVDFPIGCSQSPLAFTASLLAMLAAQNTGANSSKSLPSSSPSIRPQLPNDFNPVTNVLLQNPFASGSLPSNPSGNPGPMGAFPSSRVPPTVFPTNPTNPCGLPFFGPPVPSPKFPGLPDNRELLYQLGQQLMAMAAASGSPSEMGAKPPSGIPSWASLANPIAETGNPNVNTSNTNPNIEGHQLPTFQSSNAPFLPNPMAAMLGSTFFGHQSFALQNPAGGGVPGHNPVPVTGHQSVSLSGTANDRKTTGMISNPMLDKALHPGCLPGTGNSLSGISMRGNQKYSAYYQHQRKQGFHQLNANPMDYTGNGSNSRRQGTPLNTPMSGSRYASRRFRGNLTGAGLSTHGLGLDTRASSSGSSGPVGSRLSGGVRAPTAPSVFPGFRTSGPYGASIPVSSTISTMVPTTASNTIGKHALPNGAPASKIQSPGDPTPFASGSACTATSSVGPLNAAGQSEPTTTATRHRDTAFLCSCGQDFESLYVFTLHMKDTGHKPKSDQSERDIPKLVRGQDMWINSETEQTREILRCMRCHQSFRNLPELTMHMMKTNHYSEIVYNDSGRLVFVNPDDPHHPHSRRGSAQAGATLSGASPGKSPLSGGSPGHWLGRRGSRGPSVNVPPINPSTSTTTHSSGTESTQSAKSQPNRMSDSGARVKQEQTTERSSVSRDSQAAKEFDTDENDRGKMTPESGKTRSSDSVSQVNPTGSPVATSHHSSRASSDELIRPHTGTSERDSPMSSASTKPENIECADRAECCSVSSGDKETNVLRQIETFVENNLPRTPKGLSVKVDHGSSNASHRSASSPLATPSTDVSSRYSYGPGGGVAGGTNSDSAKSSPLGHRKRTHSEASLLTHESPVPSPASDQEKRAKHSFTHDSGAATNNTGSASSNASSLASNMPLTPTSPGVTSTTGEFGGQLRENPLSSLQKLVETTHKPVPPSAAFSTPTGVPTSLASSCYSLTPCTPTSLFISCNGSGATKTGGQHTTQHGPNTSRHTGAAGSSGPSSGTRSLGSPMDVTADSPFGVNTNPTGHSPSSQFAPIMLPASENENLIPALSALYAYVEKSSTSSPMATTTSQQQSSAPVQEKGTPINEPKSDPNVSPFSGDEKLTSMDSTHSQAALSNLPLDKLSSNPALQAIYAAAMSSLAAQYLTTQQGANRPPIGLDPLEAIKQAACNFQALLGDTKSDGSTDPALLKMLQLFTGQSSQSETGGSGRENEGAESTRPSGGGSVGVGGTSDEEMGPPEAAGERARNALECGDFDRKQSQTPLHTQRQSSSPANGSNSKNVTMNTESPNVSGSTTPNQNTNSIVSGRRPTGDMNSDRVNDDFLPARTPDSNRGFDGLGPAHSTPSPCKSNTTMDVSYANPNNNFTSRTIYSNSSNSLHPHFPNTLPGRYPTMQNRPMQTAAQQSPALMTTMITKKAKCHYCGKPFANKGQVRLHISKNKCPCLLQQSCHVAALAAAFGSDNRSLASSNPTQSKSFLKDPSLLNTKNRASAEEFLASLSSYPHMGANTALGGDSGDAAPSALSLLKERFQNFDLNQSSIRTSSGIAGSDPKTSCSSFSSISKPSQSDPNVSAATIASYGSSFGQQSIQSHSPMIHGADGSTVPPVSWPFGAPTNIPLPFTATPGTTPTSSCSGGSNVAAASAAAAAAANAGHLAAMALLAQTLVQLTSSQPASYRPIGAPPVSTGPEAFSDPSAITTAVAAAAAAAAAAAGQVPNRTLSTPTTTTSTSGATGMNSSSPLPSSPFINPTAAAFNLDLLANQTALMKQLVAMTNWPDSTAAGGASRSEENETNPVMNPFLSLANCRNTAPNGLP